MSVCVCVCANLQIYFDTSPLSHFRFDYVRALCSFLSTNNIISQHPICFAPHKEGRLHIGILIMVRNGQQQKRQIKQNRQCKFLFLWRSLLFCCTKQTNVTFYAITQARSPTTINNLWEKRVSNRFGVFCFCEKKANEIILNRCLKRKINAYFVGVEVVPHNFIINNKKNMFFLIQNCR